MTLANETSIPASVKYVTANGSATSGSGDYVAASGTLTFAPGETSKTIELSIGGDITAESTEVFSVKFSNLVDAEMPDNTAKVTIIDDDSTSWVSTTVADFEAGTIDAGAYITKTANGEITLAPSMVTDFPGTELPPDWTSTPMAAGGTTTVDNKWVGMNGASLMAGAAGYGPGRCTRVLGGLYRRRGPVGRVQRFGYGIVAVHGDRHEDQQLAVAGRAHGERHHRHRNADRR